MGGACLEVCEEEGPGWGEQSRRGRDEGDC